MEELRRELLLRRVPQMGSGRRDGERPSRPLAKGLGTQRQPTNWQAPAKSGSTVDSSTLSVTELKRSNDLHE